jgi:small GTP-binding protein
MKIKLQIWDTGEFSTPPLLSPPHLPPSSLAGQERFRTITVSYFKGAHAIMLVYDITDRDTFENIRNWISEIKEYADSKVNILLIGNKCDMEADRKVSFEEGQALANSIGTHFYEVSAKNNIRVAEAYEDVARTAKRA